ncbi:MAG: hypothetical protein AB7G93_15515 [Bdellovibrionales bacterium]
MQHKIWIYPILLGFILLSGCKSRPHKAENIETQLERAAQISGNQKVGLKDGDMVVMDKVEMSEKLRDLQNEVYALEDRVYGTRKLGSLGLYGDLKACRRKMASRQFGGSGTLVWTEPLDRLTDKEDELKIGLDEKKELVGVSEEYLRDRLNRFRGYKLILQKRADEFTDRIASCKSELASKEHDTNQPTRVMVQEVPKASVDKEEINKFMCGFVRSGASLKGFLLNAFAHGWLSLSDFKMEQNLIAVSLKDEKGVNKDNAILFNGWKLAFDRGPVSVGEVLSQDKDASLVAWTHDRKEDVPQSSTCLASASGQWNP